MDPATAGMGAAQLSMSVLSGLGGIRANDENREQQEALNEQAQQILGVANPLGASLTQAWSPGGALYRASAAKGLGDAIRTANNARNNARNNAWRTGGGGSGRFLGALGAANRAQAVGGAEALNATDLTSLQNLARMTTLQMGYDQSFPVTVSSNPYLGFAQGMNEATTQLLQPNAL